MQQLTLTNQPVVGQSYSWGAAVYRLAKLQRQQAGWVGTFNRVGDGADGQQQFVAGIRLYSEPEPVQPLPAPAELVDIIRALPPSAARWQQAAAEYVATIRRAG